MSAEAKIVDECEEFEQEIDLDTTFFFPQIMTEHIVLEKHLIIAPEYANWLVCDDDEYKAFCLFRDGKSVQETETIMLDQQRVGADVREIVSRLIAKVFGKEFLRDTTAKERSVLNSCLLCLTDGCNLRCTTCCFSCTVAGPDECKLEHWKRFFKGAEKLRCRNYNPGRRRADGESRLHQDNAVC